MMDDSTMTTIIIMMLWFIHGPCMVSAFFFLGLNKYHIYNMYIWIVGVVIFIPVSCTWIACGRARVMCISWSIQQNKPKHASLWRMFMVYHPSVLPRIIHSITSYHFIACMARSFFPSKFTHTYIHIYYLFNKIIPQTILTFHHCMYVFLFVLFYYHNPSILP